jgi:hypothetical protein
MILNGPFHRASAHQGTGLDFFFGGHLARLVFQHDWNVILHRIGEAARFADELLLRLLVQQRSFAEGAD